MLPPVIKNLLIINLICWLATMVLERNGIMIPGMLALHPIGYGFGIWQPFTYMFLHASFSHLFFNMFSLWMFGYVLENLWGSKRFLWFYILCGLGAAALNLVIGLFGWGGITVGASGAIYGVLLAFGMMFPNEYIYLYFLMPIKAKWFILGFVVIELLEGVFGSGDGMAHFAHLGGMLAGFIYIKLWQRREKRKYFNN